VTDSPTKMKRKKASEIFAAVDPHLKVIDGGTHRRHKKKESDWEKLNGAKCPQCGKDVLQFDPHRGVCISCARDMDEKEWREAKRREKLLRYVKSHNARIDKRNRARQ